MKLKKKKYKKSYYLQIQVKKVIYFSFYSFYKISILKKNKFFFFLGFYDFKVGFLFFKYHYFFYYFINYISYKYFFHNILDFFKDFNFNIIIFLSFYNWLMQHQLKLYLIYPKQIFKKIIKNLVYLSFIYFNRLIILNNKKSKILLKRFRFINF